MKVPPERRALSSAMAVVTSCFLVAVSACAGSDSEGSPEPGGPAPAPGTGMSPGSRPPPDIGPPPSPSPPPATTAPPAPSPPPSTGVPPGTGGMPGSGAPAPGRWTHAMTITLDTTPARRRRDAGRPEVSAGGASSTRAASTFSQAQANGADIRFFDAAGKALPHAIELWDPEAGSAAIWVLLDVVKANSSDQSIVMKWGNPSAPDASDSKAVFKRADGFVGVWHLDEEGNTAPDGYKDASDHEAHGTGSAWWPGPGSTVASARASTWKIPPGRTPPAGSGWTGEKAAQFNPGPPITVSLWVQGHSYPITSYETMMSKGDTSWTLQRVRYGSDQGYQSCVRTPGYHLCAFNFSGQPLVTRQWLHFMLVLQEPSMKLYINGQLNSDENAGPWNKGAHPLGIGNQTQALGGRRQWDGFIDEARVMQVARTPAWAKLEYESQKDAPTLLEFGPPRTE